MNKQIKIGDKIISSYDGKQYECTAIYATTGHNGDKDISYEWDPVEGDGNSAELIQTLNGVFSKNVTNLVIPEGITCIGEDFFNCWTQMESISLPNSLTTIKARAFQNTGLKTIMIPDSVTTIERGAFYTNFSLNSVKLSKNLKVIEEELFYENTALVDLSLPENLEVIKSSAFDGIKLCSITIPKTVTTLESRSFSFCDNLVEIRFNGTPTSISEKAFEKNNNLQTIYVPWSEGEVANAPWGATNANIIYDYKPGVFKTLFNWKGTSAYEGADRLVITPEIDNENFDMCKVGDYIPIDSEATYRISMYYQDGQALYNVMKGSEIQFMADGAWILADSFMCVPYDGYDYASLSGSMEGYTAIFPTAGIYTVYPLSMYEQFYIIRFEIFEPFAE